MGDAGDTVTAAIIIVAIVFFAFVVWPAWSGRIRPSWNITVSSFPVDAGSVSPSGNVTVLANQSQIFTANANENYTFQNWVFNGVNFGAQPQISLPSQPVNSTHTLEARFVEKTLVFEVLGSFIATKSQASVINLVLKNNGDANITDVGLKLNNPYGVLETCTVIDSANVIFHWENVLNSFSGVLFDPGNSFTRSYILNSHSSRGFTLSYVIGASVQPGVYHLSFSVMFSVVSGSFNPPPNLTVPWDVTVIG